MGAPLIPINTSIRALVAMLFWALAGCTDDLPRKESQDMPPDMNPCKAPNEFGSRCLDAGLMVSCGWGNVEYFNCAPCVDYGDGSLSCATPMDMGGL